MRKHSSGLVTAMRVARAGGTNNRRAGKERLTVGLDLGDKTSRWCLLDGEGNLVVEERVATTSQGMQETFAGLPPSLIALEVGTHSPWVSRLLQQFGHEVLVANARQLKLISQSARKDDKMDARMLARLARVGPELLRPIQHRSEQAQADRLAIQVRSTLVETRTKLVNAVRGLVKSFGERVPGCDADYFTMEQLAGLPEWLQDQMRPLLKNIVGLTGQIKAAETQIEQIAQQYPETGRLQQVYGIGPLIALTYVLTVDDPQRFQRSRDAGCYVGLQPKRRDSGEAQAQLGITREGDRYLRSLLVQGAHCLLSRRAPDSDLKRWGNKLSGRGGKNAKKRAVVAVARKLAVLLHRLWITGEVYEPLRNASSAQPSFAA